MGKGSGWGQAMADGINGYLRGMQIKEGMDDRESERAYRDEQRGRQRQEQADADSLKSDLKSAAAPVEVVQGANGMTKPDSADNSDVGQPDGPGMAQGGLIPGVTVGGQGYTDRAQADQAAAAANSPDAVRTRQSQAYERAGKPMEAAQLDAATTQGKLGKLQLTEAQEKMVNEKFDRRLMQVGSGQDLAAILSGSPLVQGAEVRTINTADGKTQLVTVGPDGQQTAMGEAFDNTAKGITPMLTKFSQSMKMPEKIAAAQWVQQHDEQTRQFQETLKIHQATQAEQSRHDRVLEGHSAATLGLQQQKFDADLKNDPFHNVPGGVKMRAQGLQKGVDLIDAALARAQTEPGFDPKAQGVQDLMARRAAQASALNKLLDPYTSAGAGSGAPASYDALKGGAGGKPGPAAAPSKSSIATAPPGGAVRQPDGSWAAAGPGQAAQGIPQAAPANNSTSAPGAQVSQAAGQGTDPVQRALNPSGNPSLEAITAPKAAAIRQAGEAVRAAQAQVVQAAQSGNQQATQQATQAAAAAGEQLKQLVGDMNPQQAQQVIQALGI